MLTSERLARPATLPERTRQRLAHTLRLDRLRLTVRLGCEASERAAPQDIEVTATIHFPHQPAGCESDQLDGTVCIAQLAAILRGVCQAGEFALIEHLAHRLYAASLAFLDERAQLELSVRKLEVPIEGLAGGVSFNIGARRERRAPRPNDTQRAVLAAGDPLLAAAISGEEQRQEQSIELIASENYTYPEVFAALGSVLSDKYSEGYPGRRYYAGQKYADAVETLARERACRLFRCEHANVQPLSGSPMNQAVYLAFLEPGDGILAMDLSHGGHLTHGAPVSHMGRIFRFSRYKTLADGSIDYDEVLRLAREARPKLLLAGFSSYPREYDYGRLRSIADDIGAIAMADVSHIGGLIAAGVLANPFDHGFDVVTTTTHKTLRGPRAGLILCKQTHARAIDRSVFPGLQGGPHMNTIAAVCVALEKALEPAFAAYGAQVLANAKVLASSLLAEGMRLVTGGTDNHLLVLDSVASVGIDGAHAEHILEQAGITSNKQLIPDDPQPPLRPSGLRLGTPAVTTRRMGQPELQQIGAWVAEALRHGADEARLDSIRQRVEALCRLFPIPNRMV